MIPSRLNLQHPRKERLDVRIMVKIVPSRCKDHYRYDDDRPH